MVMTLSKRKTNPAYPVAMGADPVGFVACSNMLFLMALCGLAPETQGIDVIHILRVLRLFAYS